MHPSPRMKLPVAFTFERSHLHPAPVVGLTQKKRSRFSHGLLDGQGDRTGSGRRSRNASYGNRVSSCRSAGIRRNSAPAATASASATEYTAGKGYQECQQSEHGSPCTPPRRDAEQQNAGHNRAARRRPPQHQRLVKGCGRGCVHGKRDRFRSCPANRDRSRLETARSRIAGRCGRD